MITKYGVGTLFGTIHDYLKVYLPKQRNLSSHTLNSYRKALEMLVDFVKLHEKVSLQDVVFEMLTADTITAFLDSLEIEHGNEISSRNTRLAAVRAFLKYAADRNIVNATFLQEMKNIPVKKANKVESIQYMSMAAISAIVEQTDVSKPSGIRDRAMLILLYDTGARVQELVDIKLSDLRFSNTATITLHGKNNKVRTVPIMEKTVQHIRQYLHGFHPDSPTASTASLFYAVSHGERHPLTSRRVRYIVKEYGDCARKICIDVPENVHPHMFRHSRAMHLYQNGMPLTLVSQWLGHAHLETTQIYAHADTEHKRTAIANATPKDSPLYEKLNSERLTITDEDMLKRLTGLNK